ncbi:MAG: DUF362 domain-containing protein [Methylocystaceae bacterium]
MAAKVYFTNMRTKSGKGMLDKLDSLLKKPEFKTIIKPGDLVAIKVHFGEMGNLAYIRPQYLRRVVDWVRDQGGKPFLTDANTLYRGTRANAVDHLQTALLNGFDYTVVGAPLVIADGLAGKDFVKVPVDGKHFKEVNIGSAAVHADAMMVISHFKGHELTGFGGAIKNLGMGLGSRSGKQQMHSDVLPRVKEDKCHSCQRCKVWCPAEAIEMVGEKPQKASINKERCWGCGECAVTCVYEAIGISWRTTPQSVQEKIVEYALGAVKNKTGKVGYINLVADVSPECDCYGFNDLAVIPDVGILASLDPVAIDQASCDLVNAMPVVSGSMLDGLVPGEDIFRAIHPGVDWEPQVAYGELMGLGSRKYELVNIDSK